jgi:hypothetical protein
MTPAPQHEHAHASAPAPTRQSAAVKRTKPSEVKGRVLMYPPENRFAGASWLAPCGGQQVFGLADGEAVGVDDGAAGVVGEVERGAADV